MAHYQPIRALWIGDDQDDFVFVRSVLANIPGITFEITWIAGYSAALDLIERQQHDVGLLDDRIGEYDGLEFLRAAIERGARAPLILLTRQGDPALHIAAI